MSKLYKITLASDFVSWGICDGTGWAWEVSEREYTHDNAPKDWQVVRPMVPARWQTATEALERAEAWIIVRDLEYTVAQQFDRAPEATNMIMWRLSDGRTVSFDHPESVEERMAAINDIPLSPGFLENVKAAWSKVYDRTATKKDRG